VVVRTLVALLALAGAASTASAQSAPSTPSYGEAVLVVSGRGYGHGVGMSQYGAYGMAKAGRTYDQILSYYYTGTSLGRAATTQLRVLLAEGRRAVAIGSAAPFSARDATGRVFKLPAGSFALGPALTLPLVQQPGGSGTQAATTPARPVPTPPIVLRPPRVGQLSLDGRAYRGQLEVGVQGGFLRVVNVVGLESYLQGVVAGEMPFTWPQEALRAQAVAARSYALATLVKGKPFDLYPDQRSQVYLGVAGEKSSTTAAVQSTAGQVVTYGGKVATTMYFSSSGGRTASAADVFGTPIPYLVSKPDPWDKASPYFRWGPVLLGGRTVQSKLDLPSRVVDASVVPTRSGRIRSLVLQTTAGSETVPASLVRSALGLRSTWVSVGVLRLDRPADGPVAYGSSVELDGVARGLGTAALASSPDAVTWSPVAALAPLSDGTVGAAVKATKTTRYRIEVAGASSPALLVEVAPRLQLARAADPDALTGTVRPRLAGATVTIERRKGVAWAPVDAASVDGLGAFRARLQLVPGSYRARIGAVSGLAAATSPVLQVSG
jgi:stage II sporulation protein D